MRSIFLCCLLAFPAAAFAQGPLAPPSIADPATGPVPPLNGSTPQPTMKTLHQVEPRTPVQALSANPPYSIIQPGSYYMTSNITVASGSAIVISTDGVNLDLNGFTISSTQTGGASGAAVSISGSRSRITVRNGSIVGGSIVPAIGSASAAGFNNGIYCTSILSQALVSDMHFTGIVGTAVFLDVGGVIERCTVSNCGTGFRADEIRACRAIRCADAGIFAFSNVSQSTGEATNGVGVFAGANARDCKGTSTSGNGLQTDGNAENCVGVSTGTAATAHGMEIGGNVVNCLGTANGGSGIYVLNNARDCKATSTEGVGIDVRGNAENCVGSSAGTGAEDYGIYIAGNVSNSTGLANESYGIYTLNNAIGCRGISSAGTGLRVVGNAENCTGTSSSSSTDDFGLYVSVNALNCSGTATTGVGAQVMNNATGCRGFTQGSSAAAYGLRCYGTANSCSGSSSGGSSIALSAAIAIGCTYTGTLSVPAGKTFNM